MIGDGTVVSTGAIVFAGSTIGARVILGDQSCVRERVAIGDDVVVGRGSLVENDTTIGARTKIQADAYVTAYSTLEEDVFVAPCVVTTNDNFMGRTEKRLELMKGPTIRRGARIGGGAILCPGIEVGEEAFVGAGAVVTKDVAAAHGRRREPRAGDPRRARRRAARAAVAAHGAASGSSGGVPDDEPPEHAERHDLALAGADFHHRAHAPAEPVTHDRRPPRRDDVVAAVDASRETRLVEPRAGEADGGTHVCRLQPPPRQAPHAGRLAGHRVRVRGEASFEDGRDRELRRRGTGRRRKDPKRDGQRGRDQSDRQEAHGSGLHDREAVGDRRRASPA